MDIVFTEERNGRIVYVEHNQVATKERATIEMLKDYHFYAIEGNPDEIEKGYFTEDTAYVLYTNGDKLSWEITE